MALWRPTSSTKHQHLAAAEQRAAVHRAGLAVDAVLLAHQLRACRAACAWRMRALRASGSAATRRSPIRSPNTVPWPQPVVTTRRAVFRSKSLDAGARAHRRGADVPVDGDRLDVVDRVDQALVAQVAEHQQLGLRAQRHQRDQLALVDEHASAAARPELDAAPVAELVEDARSRASARALACVSAAADGGGHCGSSSGVAARSEPAAQRRRGATSSAGVAPRLLGARRRGRRPGGECAPAASSGLLPAAACTQTGPDRRRAA